METPKYLIILAQYKWLLAVGVLISIGVGLAAGFTVRDGEIVSRVEQTYPASTTLLLSSPGTPLFQAEIPRETVPIDGSALVTDPVTLSLTDAALIYAYLVAGRDIQARVEEQIGELADTESITAVSRTTQPSGDENFPGRLSLPVLDVVAYASDPGRAELISRTAASEFIEYVTEEQDIRKIEPEYRVTLTTLRENKAGEGTGSNPAIPIVVGIGGTFVAFIALAFLLHAVRLTFAARSPRPTGQAESEADLESEADIDAEADIDPVGDEERLADDIPVTSSLT